MSWVKFAIFTLGLMMCASPATAAKITQFTDSEGTVHITNPGTEDHAPAAQPKIPLRSHRTINPYAPPTWPPPPIRPSPYLKPDGQRVTDSEAPSPEVKKLQPSQEPPGSAPARPESPAERLRRRR